VPVAAAGQAEVGAADAKPVVALRRGEHVVEQRFVPLLELLALDQRPAGVGDPAGERVAALLQLAEVEHPRRSRGGDPVRHVDPAEALGDQPGELTLQLADLPPQLRPRAGLVQRPVGRADPPGDQGRPVDPRSPIEQIRHGQSLSGLEGGCSNP
jgi:hypothetical protein